jgi:hypothetical protein
VESFNGRLSNKSLKIEIFSSLPEAKLLAKQHRAEYNFYIPHLALRGHIPLDVRQQWKGGLITHQLS